MHDALLWVLAEVGDAATLEEFQDWYDNEHVPLRLSQLKDFETGVRYRAIDDQVPSWSAIYEITDPQLFSQERYTSLREKRSPREGELIVRLATVDRRTYTKLLKDTSGSSPPRGKASAAAFEVTVASDKEADIDAFRNVDGWKRSHAYKLGDSLVTGHGKQPSQNNAPAFVTVHEFASDAFRDAAELKKLLSSNAEVRQWKLYRAWDNTAS